MLESIRSFRKLHSYSADIRRYDGRNMVFYFLDKQLIFLYRQEEANYMYSRRRQQSRTETE